MGDVSLVSIKTQKQRKSCCSYISTLMTIYNDINQDCRSRLSRWKFCTFDAWSQLRCHKLSQSVIAQKRYSVTLKSLDQAIDLVFFSACLECIVTLLWMFSLISKFSLMFWMYRMLFYTPILLLMFQVQL